MKKFAIAIITCVCVIGVGLLAYNAGIFTSNVVSIKITPTSSAMTTGQGLDFKLGESFIYNGSNFVVEEVYANGLSKKLTRSQYDVYANNYVRHMDGIYPIDVEHKEHAEIKTKFYATVGTGGDNQDSINARVLLNTACANSTGIANNETYWLHGTGASQMEYLSVKIMGSVVTYNENWQHEQNEQGGWDPVYLQHRFWYVNETIYVEELSAPGAGGVQTVSGRYHIPNVSQSTFMEVFVEMAGTYDSVIDMLAGVIQNTFTLGQVRNLAKHQNASGEWVLTFNVVDSGFQSEGGNPTSEAPNGSYSITLDSRTRFSHIDIDSDMGKMDIYVKYGDDALLQMFGEDSEMNMGDVADYSTAKTLTDLTNGGFWQGITASVGGWNNYLSSSGSKVNYALNEMFDKYQVFIGYSDGSGGNWEGVNDECDFYLNDVKIPNPDNYILNIAGKHKITVKYTNENSRMFVSTYYINVGGGAGVIADAKDMIWQTMQLTASQQQYRFTRSEPHLNKIESYTYINVDGWRYAYYDRNYAEDGQRYSYTYIPVSATMGTVYYTDSVLGENKKAENALWTSYDNEAMGNIIETVFTRDNFDFFVANAPDSNISYQYNGNYMSFNLWGIYIEEMGGNVSMYIRLDSQGRIEQIEYRVQDTNQIVQTIKVNYSVTTPKAPIGTFTLASLPFRGF